MSKDPVFGDLVLLRRENFSEDMEYTKGEIGRYISRDGPRCKIELFPRQRVCVPRSAFDVLSDVLPSCGLSRSLARVAEYLFRIAGNDAPAYYRERCKRLLDDIVKALPTPGPTARVVECALANLRAYLPDCQAAVLQGKHYMRNAGKAIAEMDGWNPELYPEKQG